MRKLTSEEIKQAAIRRKAALSPFNLPAATLPEYMRANRIKAIAESIGLACPVCRYPVPIYLARIAFEAKELQHAPIFMAVALFPSREPADDANSCPHCGTRLVVKTAGVDTLTESPILYWEKHHGGL